MLTFAARRADPGAKGSLAMLRTLYNNALFHVGQRIRTGHVLKTVHRLLAERDEPPRLLDAGAGGGGLSFALAAELPRATIEGVELVPEKVGQANQHAAAMGLGNVSFSVGDVTRIGRHGDFDLAVSVDVFEHVEDDQSAMRSVLDALRPGGVFVMHVPRAEPRRFLAHLEDHHQDDHVRDGYVPDELRERLTATGFRVREVRQTFGTAGELAWEIMQVGMRWRGRAGELMRIAAWPLLALLCALDVRLGGGRRGNGLLVIAERPRSEAASGGCAACA
jgi:SAM-dependent methyltransferase